MLGIWSIQYEAKRRGNISVLPTFHSKEQPTSVKGFSLIELLIVVAIILIIAAIAIPNLLRSRMAANEASAVGSIRTINTAAITYNSVYGNGFPPSLASMGTTGSSAVSCTNAELLDSVVTGGTKSGYTFALVHGSTILTSAASSCSGGYGYADGYVATATPVTVGTTGQRAFCSDATGVIRFSASGTATTATPYCSSTMNPLQ
jgi:prepilin-type N-terminal cleavage/methylation domain-containing protein